MIINGINETEKRSVLVLLEKLKTINFSKIEFNFRKDINFVVEKKDNVINVAYTTKANIFRSLLISAVMITEDRDGKVCEKQQFETCGIMLDMSRGGVMTVEAVKSYIEYMALLGLNSLMLYTEDTYEVESLPYFGYMRGRYSKNELKAIDNYGSEYGIEVIPCIQTLGHFEQYIKWMEGKQLSDTATVMMAENEKVYEFIEKLIKKISECFETGKIHIGMDEAWGLGTGNYLKEKGYKNGTEIFCEHIRKVKEITDKYNLEPMIWSDMYFQLSSTQGKYYDRDVEVPDFVKELLPENVSIVYWDYYNTEKEMYKHMLSEHKNITDNVIFAGGIWTWAGMLPDYKLTFDITNTGLTVCKEQNIKDVYATVWGDDGCETVADFSLPGCALYAEHFYNRDINEDELNKKIKLLFNVEISDLKDISDALYPFGKFELEKSTFNIKMILYNDILCGIADADMMDDKLIAEYRRLNEKFEALSKVEGYFKEHFKYVSVLCKLAADKIGITQKLHSGYRKNDALLKEIKDDLLAVLADDFRELKNIHYRLWHSIYKPFGFEIVDGRYGIKLERIITAAMRLREYLNDDIKSLPELEEKRIPFASEHCFAGLHSGISSAYLVKGY